MKTLIVIGAIAIIALGMWIQIHRGDELMREFHGTKVDINFFNTGPFLAQRNVPVYRIETPQGVLWIRESFGRSVYRENADGTYTELK